MASKVQLIGGKFQDAEGNALAFGKLIFKLSQDAVTTDGQQVVGGVEITIYLNINGDVFGTQHSFETPGQYIWPNDELLPDVTFYEVTAYSEDGQLAWAAPQTQLVVHGTTFDLGTWIPNAIIPPQLPGVQGVTIEVDDVISSDQAVINLKSGKNVTITDDIHGGKTFAAAGPGDFVSNVFITATLAPGGQERGTWLIGKAFELSKVSLNIPARLRLYRSTAARDLDQTRPNYISPTPGLQNEVICDLYLTGVGDFSLNWIMSPPALAIDSKTTPDGFIAYTVDNLSNTSAAVTAALTYFKKG
jgi:hypothetical protein